MAGDKGKKEEKKEGKKTYPHTTQQKITERIKNTLIMRAKGLKKNEIARALQTNSQAIDKILKQFSGVFEELENVEKYQDVKTSLLSATELRLLKSLNNPEKIDKATLNQTAYSFDIIHKAGRLEKGQATDIKASYSRIISDDYKIIDTTKADD